MMSGPAKAATIILLAGIIVGTVLAFRALRTPDLPSSRGAGIQRLEGLIPDGSKDMAGLIVANYREYRANAARWSFIYFGCVFGSALLSAMAGVLLKLELLGGRPALRSDLAASLAATAALLVTLSTVGDFGRKWRANRIAAAAMENLAYDLLKRPAGTDRAALVAKIQEINSARNDGIVGEVAPPPKLDGSTLPAS